MSERKDFNDVPSTRLEQETSAKVKACELPSSCGNVDPHFKAPFRHIIKPFQHLLSTGYAAILLYTFSLRIIKANEQVIKISRQRK